MVGSRVLEMLSDVCGIAAMYFLFKALLYSLQMRRRLDPREPPGLQWRFHNRGPRAWPAGFLGAEKQYRRLYGDDLMWRRWFRDLNLSLALFVLSGVLLAACLKLMQEQTM